MVRCTVVARGLREKYPEATLWAYVPKVYHDIYAAARCIDRLVDAPFQARRPRDKPLDSKKWPYLKPPEGIEEFDLDIDLYDPAFRYELRSGPGVVKDRIQLWCEAAGIRPASYTPRLYIEGRPLEKARALLESKLCNPWGPQSAFRNRMFRNHICRQANSAAIGRIFD